jgi:hypothetical protein
MANHNLPTLTSTYANFVTEMDARMDDISIGFDPALTTVTNMATGTIRWVAASNKWQKWSGSTWNDLAATYAISISGNATTATQLATARAINGVDFNGTAPISINLNNALTVNNSGSGVASGATFNGGSAIVISYNSVGAPSVTGAGASGTWAISITGNAATVTNGVYTTGTQSIAGVKSFTNSIREAQVSMPTDNLDLSLANYFTKTISAATTLTLTNVPTAATAVSIILELTNGGSAAVTWWPNIKWKNGTAPALTALGRDVLTFYTHDGGNSWVGSLALKNIL